MKTIARFHATLLILSAARLFVKNKRAFPRLFLAIFLRLSAASASKGLQPARLPAFTAPAGASAGFAWPAVDVVFGRLTVGAALAASALPLRFRAALLRAVPVRI
jgi:hypothetical protein